MDTKPGIIILSERLLWFSLVFVPIKIVLETRIGFASIEAEANRLIVFALELVFSAFLIYKISKAKNWARWVFVALLFIGFSSYISQMIQDWSFNRTYAFLVTLQTLVQFFGSSILFLPNSNNWFSRHG